VPQLHETRTGQRLFEVTLPKIAKALERIANALENRQFSDNHGPEDKHDENCERIGCTHWNGD